MKYISTRSSSESLPFESVFIKGLADDGGLFLPVSYTHLTLPTIRMV